MYYSEESAGILFETAKKMKLDPRWITDYGLFSILVNQKRHPVFYTNSVLNSQLSNYLSRNKHITRVLLEKNRLPNIPFLLPQNRNEIAGFLKIHKKIIIKPTLGSRSQDVKLVTSPRQLEKVSVENVIVEKYIIGRELRYVFLEGKIIGALEKLYDTPVHDPNNVKRATIPRNDWDRELIRLALRTAGILELEFGCIDFLVEKNKKVHILEANSAPSLRKFHRPDRGEPVDIARKFLEATVKKYK